MKDIYNKLEHLENLIIYKGPKKLFPNIVSRLSETSLAT